MRDKYTNYLISNYNSLNYEQWNSLGCTIQSTQAKTIKKVHFPNWPYQLYLRNLTWDLFLHFSIISTSSQRRKLLDTGLPQRLPRWLVLRCLHSADSRNLHQVSDQPCGLPTLRLPRGRHSRILRPKGHLLYEEMRPVHYHFSSTILWVTSVILSLLRIFLIS